MILEIPLKESQHFCRVGKIYQKKCNNLELCNPKSEFGMIETCAVCKRTI